MNKDKTIFKIVQPQQTDNKYVVKRAKSSFKDLVIHIIVGIMLGWWFAHGYVVENGGIWPTFSSFSWFMDYIVELGGLTAFISLGWFVYKVFFKGRNGDKK